MDLIALLQAVGEAGLALFLIVFLLWRDVQRDRSDKEQRAKLELEINNLNNKYHGLLERNQALLIQVVQRNTAALEVVKEILSTCEGTQRRIRTKSAADIVVDPLTLDKRD